MSAWSRHVKEYLGVTVGIGMTALALDLFLIPNRIAAGGVSGLATILFYLFGLPVGMVMLLFNIPLLAFSMRALGRSFGVKTIYGSVLLSVLVDSVAPFVSPLTTDSLLASVYGGVLAGIGMGVAFKSGGSTGGTDMAARLVNHYTGVSVGMSLLAVDGAVIVLAGLVFTPELALIALLSLFLTSKAIDLIQEGRAYAKAVWIISRESSSIGKAILQELDRGVTSLDGHGLFTGESRDVLFVIIGRAELTELRNIVNHHDKDAFMVITDVHDVLGEGFRPRHIPV